MAVNKSSLASDLEKALNSSLPGGDDFEKEADIKKKNKKIAKMMADAIDKFVKSASVDVSGLETLPGTQVTTNPGQPVVAPGAGATTGPGTGMTSGPGKENPASGIDCCKVY
tara:strand:+ start:47 stop:382 length:336 start_codon:yes stop_codon:yes gene_type:complete